MKKRVLIITEAISYGGLNIAAIKFQQYLNKDKFECVFCVRRNDTGELEQEILNKGIKVIHVPDSELGYLKSYIFYKKIMQQGHFDIIHCHLPFISGIVLFAARQCGIKKRVAHAHFSQAYTDVSIYSKKKQLIAVIYRKIMRVFLKMFCNEKIACSRQAGEFLFGKREFEKNGTVLNNGIETENFIYDDTVRNNTRAQLNIPSTSCVLGHIGQLYSVKNQSFVIDVFNEFHKINNNSCLLIIGDGTDREMLEQKTNSLNLTDCVRFLGLRRDVARLYQAMDCFVFPSIHEGFPLTLIEAQASKLPCIISDTVAKETKINENIEFLSVNEPPRVWAEKILQMVKLPREQTDNSQLIKKYDIKNIALELENIYLN